MTITVKNSTGATQTISTIDDLLAVASTAEGQAAILAKLSSDPATQTTLAAILAKIIDSPATSAKQDTLAGLVSTAAGQASILAKLSSDPATATGQASILAKLSADPATQTTLAAILAKLTADPATQTTLTAILNKLIASPATSAKQDSLAALVGEVQVTPTTYTLLARLKDISTNLAILLGTGIGPIKYTVAVIPDTPFTLCRALNVGVPGLATLTYENTTTGEVYLTEGWNPISCTNVSASGLDADLISAGY